MSNDKLKFWTYCPECKKSFGVMPRLVLQYLNRLVEAHGFDTPEQTAEPKAPEGGERERAESQAPAATQRKPYRRSYANRGYPRREAQ